jgi:hypothetical protein
VPEPPARMMPFHWVMSEILCVGERGAPEAVVRGCWSVRG